MTDCNWVPNDRVGLFVFGKPVQPHVAAGLLTLDPELSDPADWDCYRVADDAVTVYTEEGRIISIHCDDRCLYHGLDLIGMSFDLLRSVVASEPEEDVDTFELDGAEQQVYEFDELGAQVWVLDGEVVTVICSDTNDV